MKRIVEIFIAGCPVCNPVLDLVKETAFENCEIIVYDLVKHFEEKVGVAKMKDYNISKLPSVVINGELLNCREGVQLTREDLLKAGIGNE